MKTLRLCFAVAAIMSFTTIFSQDIIYKKDGTKDTAVVEEITPGEIVYKRYNRAEGPTYRILKYEVLLIAYKDGSVDMFHDIKGPDEKNKYNHQLGRNIITLNYFNILNGNLHMMYERILPSDIMGLKFSMNLGLAEVGTDILNYYRKYTVGVDFNIYPTGQGKVKYFLGPAIRTGLVENSFSTFDINFGTETKTQYSYLSLMINNGFYVQATPKLYIGLQAAVGLANFSAKNTTPSPFSPSRFSELDGIIAFNMGWRF